MKIDQVAFYCSTPRQADEIKAQFRLLNAEWLLDRVEASSTVLGVTGINVAELQFNYSLGIELEILRYVDGEHWHRATNPHYSRHGAPFLSHVGIHLADGEEFPSMVHSRLVQETFTLSHTGKFLTDPSSVGYGRKYHYRVFELAPGSYIKFIRRIPPATTGSYIGLDK